MAESLYITGTEARSGKSAIALSIIELLMRKIHRVGFFRPIIADQTGKDSNINLISEYFELNAPYEAMYGFTAGEATALAAQGKTDQVIEGVITKYNELKEAYDFVVVDGTNYALSTAAFEFDINAELSKNLSAPVLLVANAHNKSMAETLRSVEVAMDSLHEKKCQTIGIIINRILPEYCDGVLKSLPGNPLMKNQLIYTVPELSRLDRPTIEEIAEVLSAEIITGECHLSRHFHRFIVGTMEVQNFIKTMTRGDLVITTGDRVDIIVACLAVAASCTGRKISGIILTGGFKPDKAVLDIIRKNILMVPILAVEGDTFEIASRINRIHTKISPRDERKITQVLAHVEKHVDTVTLENTIVNTHSRIITPKMFEYNLIRRAKKNRQHIVLPEGVEDRILQATETLLRREVADITLLGSVKKINEKIDFLGLRMKDVNIIDPEKSDWFNDFVESYYNIRKNKGITIENSRDLMRDRNFFATMMVYSGKADAMVSGSVHSTADTIRPALQIIKTRPGVSIVSSILFMCLEDRILVYGDCAVNPDPNAQQLAEIALSSSQTARAFGIDPVVAMLSYSTGTSGTGADVDKVREATKIAREKANGLDPDLKIEGPIQYDAAVDIAVAKTKLPESEVAGRATVFIFPDLNTGNNTYKAVQRSANAVVIGPVLQGLKYPVNDLSRGCTVSDIVNTVAITAIQAQFEKKLI